MSSVFFYDTGQGESGGDIGALGGITHSALRTRTSIHICILLTLASQGGIVKRNSYRKTFDKGWVRVNVVHVTVNATIQPLGGKYYGTEITICDDKGNETEIVVWMMGDYEPSSRQIEYWGLTPAQWKAGALVDDGMGGKVPCRQELICDSHYESADGYALCEKIANALNAQNKTRHENNH